MSAASASPTAWRLPTRPKPTWLRPSGDELKKARDGAAEVRSGAERQAGQVLEEARAEAGRIVTAAKKAAEEEAALAAQRAKEQLREQVAQLAVAGAERILRREIDANRHAELLGNLKNELH